MLGCWRVLLLPSSADPVLAQEASQLQKSLQGCGWEYPDSALLKVSSGNEGEDSSVPSSHCGGVWHPHPLTNALL